MIYKSILAEDESDFNLALDNVKNETIKWAL
jgi:hypothetical protein